MTRRSLRLWLLAFLLLAGLPLRSFAALSSATVWEARGGGVASDNNGGGFVAGSGGTDRSQQNAAQVAIDNATITTSITTSVITFTGSTYTVLAGDVGNIVQMLTGTNVTAGFYQITSVSAGLNGTWTMDRNVVTSGTTTDATGNMGGALLTLGKLSGAMVASNKAFATGSFISTTTTTFSQANTGSSANPPGHLIGYGSTRGDGIHATLALQTNTGLTGLAFTGARWQVENFDVDCGSLGTSTGIAVGLVSLVLSCKVANFTTAGISGTNIGNHISDCEVTGGTSAATAGIKFSNAQQSVTRCNVHDNACAGIQVYAYTSVMWCLVTNNSGASSDGIVTVNGSESLIQNNTIHGNGRHGISNGSDEAVGLNWRNNIITSNGGFGIKFDPTSAVGAQPLFDGNAYWNNTSGTRSNGDSVSGIYGVNPYTNVRDLILTASPYVGPTSGSTANFALNDVPGGGRACRRAGSPSGWPGNTGTTSYPDMGAVQTRSVIRRPFFGF